MNTFKVVKLGLVMLLLGSLGGTLVSAQASSSFPDIANSPYRVAIEYLADQGIVSGYPDGTFKPQNQINRAELLKILVGGSGFKPTQEAYNSCFPDVNKEWFAAYVCYAKSKKWIDGYPDGTFKPDKTVNSAEAIKMLVNSQNWEPGSGGGSWFDAYVQTAKDKKVILTSDGVFNPSKLMLRGVMSLYLYRALTGETMVVYVPADNVTDDNSGLVAWANEGGDKVTKDELRATNGAATVENSVWDGEKIKIFGAKNEVVNFDLIIESPQEKRSQLNVIFDNLNGPGGSNIAATPWGDIELFYVRYLEIKGKSAFIGESYDQRHLPAKMRTSYDPNTGSPTGTWTDRPNHNKFYPEIAVPLALENNFSISANENQSIWADIYIPKNSAAGTYNGSMQIQQENNTVKTIPVELEVYDFTLPDEPNSKVMLSLGYGDINERYMGTKWPNDAASLAEIQSIRDEYFKLAHRHKISLIDNDSAPNEDRPADQWMSRLSGELFTEKNGYHGPGMGVGNGIYSIGHYGSWSWKDGGKVAMQQHANAWESWFEENFPNVEHFLYLIDESSDYAQIEEWAQWIEQTDGPGKNLMSLATTWVGTAYEKMPSLDIPTSSMYVAKTNETEEAMNYYRNQEGKKIYFYNGGRPGQGSFMTEDDGVALRELPWGQYKKGIDRWFYWESTYYNNYQAGLGETNVFEQAHTFGGYDRFDEVNGETGGNYSNGDGVLFYPGTDKIFSQESYNVQEPIASLRLKYWRRGIQDVDYLALAKAKNPQKVEEIIQKIVPKVLWEYGVADPNDPTWVRSEIIWSDNPDVWEQARKELADIISQR